MLSFFDFYGQKQKLLGDGSYKKPSESLMKELREKFSGDGGQNGGKRGCEPWDIKSIE